MTAAPGEESAIAALQRSPRFETLFRVGRYALWRALSLMGVLVVGVYLTILVTNKAVVLDRDLDDNISPIQGWFAGIANPYVETASPQTPAPDLRTFIEGSLVLLIRGLTFDFVTTPFTYTVASRNFFTPAALIRDALPRTLLVFGLANVLLFISSVGLALGLARQPGSRLNRLVMALAPVSAVPAWLVGVLIVVFMARVLHIFPGGLWDAWPDEFSWSYVRFVLRHITPAVLAIFLSKFFQSVLTWRAFMLVSASEDYVELAKAKGLSPSLIERRYLLRPVLPAVLTSFTLLMIGIWQEAIVLELFFSVAGIGHVFYNAIRFRDMAVIISLTVMFAYLLAITVFVLDIAYALVDPRVKLGADGQPGRVVEARRRRDRRDDRPRKASVPWRPWPHGGAFLRRTTDARRQRNRPAAADIAASALALARSVGQRGARLALAFVRHPPALAGMLIVAGLIGVSAYAIVKVPYAEAVRLWTLDNTVWAANPPNAFPAWVNVFRRQELPVSLAFNSQSPGATKTVEVLDAEVKRIKLVFPVDYRYGAFPQAVDLQVNPVFDAKLPFAAVTWLTPDGREVSLGEYILEAPQSLDFREGHRDLEEFLAGRSPQVALFEDPARPREALPGRYELRVEALVFEAEADMEAAFQLQGEVYGLAGTDHRRRDITLALMWGAPVALAVGVAGALGTSLLSMLIAAAGAWFGGRLDWAVQRLTEVNLVLPAFPILLVIYNFYAKSVWVLLGVAVLLGIFGSSIKTYRAAFLQVKEAPFVEAARSYGAGDWRIIMRYLLPRIVPVLVPQMVLAIPSYVFLEATLAFLNISDPQLPTWGKLLQAGMANGGLDGPVHTILLPVGALLLTSIGFLLIGYSLERVLNPRLRV
jgi:peptide/nickel transport system permease protein